MRKIAGRIDSAIGPIKKSQIKDAQNQLQAGFLEELERYNSKILPILSKRQQDYDSPEEYAHVASKCKKWDEKLHKK